MPKQPFVLNDESINSYGFRVLTSGIVLDVFRKNPVMLYSHIRGYERASGDPLLPLGRWDNLHQDGTKLVGESDFDMDDEFAVKVSKKVEKGVLNACSIGIDIIEISEDPSLMLPGQTMPTITKCILKEVSICDIPSNSNALRLKYQGATVCLDSNQHSAEELENLFSTNKTESSMKTLISVLNSMKLGVTLTDDAKEGDVVLAFQKALTSKDDALATRDAKITELNTKITDLTLAQETAMQNAINDKANALVELALTSKKIMPAQKDSFLKLAKNDYDTTKTILEGMAGHSSVSGQLNNGGSGAELSDDAKKSAMYDDLRKSNKLAALKESNFAEFKELHKARFGTDYTGGK